MRAAGGWGYTDWLEREELGDLEVGVRFGEGFAPGDEDYVVVVVAVEMARLRAVAADATGGGAAG